MAKVKKGDGKWVTINGRPVFIAKGQTLSEAMAGKSQYVSKNSKTETKSSTPRKAKDADLIGKKLKYNGSEVKVLRKLTEQEKQKRAYAANPDAGDYYEVETTSKEVSPSKFIVWEARLRSSLTKDPAATEGTAKRRTSNAVPRGFSSYYNKVDPEYYEKYGVSNDVGSTIKVAGKKMKVIGVAYPKEQFEGFINEETVFITDSPETPVVIREKDGIRPVDIEKVRSQVRRERAKWFGGRP